MYLNLETKNWASPWSGAPERVPFTLKISAELGSSINWELVHVARVVFVFQAIDDTEIIGYCPRDFSFLRLQDFKGKRLFQYEYFITSYCPLVGWGGCHLLAWLLHAFLITWNIKINWSSGRYCRKEICGFRICTQTCYFCFFFLCPLCSPWHTQDNWKSYSNDTCSWKTAIISTP